MFNIDDDIRLLDLALKKLEEKILEGNTQAQGIYLEIKAFKSKTIDFHKKVNEKIKRS